MLAGLLCTRTLYDKEMLQAIRMSNGLGGRADPLVSDAARSDATQEPAADAKLQRRYFRPPPFRLSRCARSLFAIFVGLTLWVGVWDLVDYHVLPALTSTCASANEPNPSCGAVKAGLVVIGALGLYCTRSLYGEKKVHAAQFQRFQ